MYALNAVGLPFFALRTAFGAVGSGTLYSSEHQLLTAACYLLGILWVGVVCGARLYSGVSSPADVQGGMLVGGVLVRTWLPLCESINLFLSSRDDVAGLPQWAFLTMVALGLMLLHPYTKGDPRSWTALAYSAKAIAFATSFIVGSNTCARREWCVASRSSWEAALTLESTATCALRCTIGFALLGLGSLLADAVSKLLTAQLKVLMPTKPCAPTIARNAAVFGATGLIISLCVPAVLTALGL